MEQGKQRSPVVVVHGIGGGDAKTKSGYSRSLRELVLADLEGTKRDTYWFEAAWEGVNDNIDQQIRTIMADFARRSKCPSPSDYSGKRYKRLVYIWRAVKYCGMQVMLKDIVPKVMDYLLDLPLYLGEPKGGDIRKKVREVVEAHPGCVLVGHSLGSLICYDLVREMRREKGQETGVKALVTLGTPIGWVTRIRQADGLETGPFGIDLPWHNVYHPADPVCLHKGLDEQVFKGVSNRKVDVSTGRNKLREGLAAHVSYWIDPDVAKTITESAQW